jgi:two-component system cell cycle response regulator
MNDEIRLKNKTKVRLLATINQVDLLTDSLEGLLISLEKSLQETFNHQVKKDYQAIQTAYEKLRSLTNGLLEVVDIDQVTLQDKLRITRHDMRAAVGGIMGYAELVLDDFSQEDKNAHALALFHSLINTCQEILPVIDSLKLEEGQKELGEGEETALNYCMIHYTGRILIIDDDVQKLEMLYRRLSNVGHTVLTAPDGLRGLDGLSKTPVDLILLDMLMPGMDGYEVLTKIKENPKWSDIPILVISSMSDLQHVAKCIRAGADDYLPMPVNNTLLHARINSCLYKKLSHDREVTTLKELDTAKKRLSTAIESINEGFAVFDQEDRLTMANKPFRDMYPAVDSSLDKQITYEEFLNLNLKEGIYQLERRREDVMDQESIPSTADEFLKTYICLHQNPLESYTLLLSSGQWIEVIENRIPQGGTVVIHKDVSEERKRAIALNHMATHDALTGLANRALYEKMLETAVAKAAETKTLFAILYFDLDGFKKINDTKGHEAGDYILKSSADILRSHVRHTDLIARLGGDEFAALITNLESEEEARNIADRCVQAIDAMAVADPSLEGFGVSIGMAFYPKDGRTSQSLLSYADELMYTTKRERKARLKVVS